MTRLTGVTKAAFIVSLLMAVFIALAAVLKGPLLILPFAGVPLFAAIGLRRGRPDTAYGFAIYLLTQSLALPILLLTGNVPMVVADVASSVIWGTAIGVLFIFAGRSLSAAGGSGRPKAPWLVLSVLLILPFAFVHPFVIPTGAMENTILVGDRLLVKTFPRAKPERGEMIVFRYPVDHRQTFVKRVIGMPGDRIRISHKQVFLNGTPYREPYAVHKTDFEDLYRDDFPSEPNMAISAQGIEMLSKHVSTGDVVVPAGKYFVMGDNRDQSLDSRYWGFVSEDEVVGTPFLIYDSEDQSPEDVTTHQTSFPRHVRWNRIGKTL